MIKLEYDVEEAALHFILIDDSTGERDSVRFDGVRHADAILVHNALVELEEGEHAVDYEEIE